MSVTVENILKAKSRLINQVHHTPIITSQTINQIAGCSVVFKCEHLQKTGSFKARGAMNAVLLIREETKFKGVITHSSGNHGQALAYAAKKAGLPCYVVVPHDTFYSKRAAISQYGGEVVLCEPTLKSRKETCVRLSSELGYEVVEPFDDINVINGQGTIGTEIIEQVPDVDAVFLAVGGGGMASGVTLFIKEMQPNVRVFLVEPAGKDLVKYLTSGKSASDTDVVNTIADGIRVMKVGSNCYPILKKYCTENIITVTDSEIIDALGLIWTRTKQRVEPSAAVPLAGLLKISPKDLAINKAVVVLCGGNVDIDFKL